MKSYEILSISIVHSKSLTRAWDFFKFGTALPATMTHCQKCGICPEEAPCRFTTFGKMPKIVGTLPKVPHLTLTGPDQTYI